MSTTPRTPKRPNILIILTDEERYPVPEETPELKRFRETELIGRRWLQESGTTFHNHYTAATACTPSRACLFTGQYNTIHGVSETFGFAKVGSSFSTHTRSSIASPLSEPFFLLFSFLFLTCRRQKTPAFGGWSQARCPRWGTSFARQDTRLSTRYDDEQKREPSSTRKDEKETPIFRDKQLLMN